MGSGSAFAGPYIDRDCGDDEHALDDVLPVGRDGEDVQAVVEGLDEQEAQDCAPDGAASAHQACPADDDGSDGVQFVALAQRRGPADDAGGEHDAGEACQGAADGVDTEENAPGFYPGDLGGEPVAAHGVDPQPVGGAAHHQPETHDAQDHEHNRDGQAQDLGVGDLPKGCRKSVDGRAVTDDEGQSGGQGQHSQGGDEGRYVDQRDNGTIDTAGYQPDEYSDEDGEPDLVWEGLGEQGTGHCADGDDAAYGQIDAAGEDDESLSQGDQGERGCRDEDRCDVIDRAEPRTAVEKKGDHEQHDDDHRVANG